MIFLQYKDNFPTANNSVLKFAKVIHVSGNIIAFIWNILNLFTEKITYHLIALTVVSLILHIYFILLTFKVKIITRLTYYEA